MIFVIIKFFIPDIRK